MYFSAKSKRPRSGSATGPTGVSEGSGSLLKAGNSSLKASGLASTLKRGGRDSGAARSKAASKLLSRSE